MAGLRVSILCVSGLFLVAAAQASHHSSTTSYYVAPPFVAYSSALTSFLPPSYAPPPAMPPAYMPPMAMPQAYAQQAAPSCLCMPERAFPIACATPAPASPGPTTLATDEPPLMAPPTAAPKTKGPMIQQNRTFGGVPQVLEPRSAMCKVSFWNLSGADVTLSVNDRTEFIARDRGAVIELPRSFSWRTNNLNAKTEDVPDDLNHFEVMIK